MKTCKTVEIPVFKEGVVWAARDKSSLGIPDLYSNVGVATVDKSIYTS
jgi:hypothetical protein